MNIAGVGDLSAAGVDAVVGVPVGSLAAFAASTWWHGAVCYLCVPVRYPELLGLTVYSNEAAMVAAALLAGGAAGLVTHVAQTRDGTP